MSVETELEEERKVSQIVDYLQAPRKKRKNYVLFALSKNFDADTMAGMENYLRQAYPGLALSQARTPGDLLRMYSRQIVLLVIDDQFASMQECMDVVKALKIKKTEATVPVIFMTDNSSILIEEYHKNLLPYQESDNYIRYRSMPLPRICARLQSALNLKRGRRSRRIKVTVPIQYLHFTKDKYFQGEITDISMHGGILVAKENEIFRVNDQLRLHIPTHKFLPTECGEFLRLSAKVRRVLIGGNTVGVSWEYLSEDQQMVLIQYVTELTNSYLIRSANNQKHNFRQT